MTRCAVKDCVNPTIQGKRCCFWHSDKEQDYEKADRAEAALIALWALTKMGSDE